MHNSPIFASHAFPCSGSHYDLYSPRVRRASSRGLTHHITGDFEVLTKPILDTAARNAGRALDIPQGHIIVPVHELQVPHILDK